MLFRWFVGLAIDDPVWDHSVFSKNRDRLLEHEVVEAFFAEVMKRADAAELAQPGALLGGRNVDPGLGQSQELQAPGRRRRSDPRRLGQECAGQLEGQAAEQ